MIKILRWRGKAKDITLTGNEARTKDIDKIEDRPPVKKIEVKPTPKKKPIKKKVAKKAPKKTKKKATKKSKRK